MMSDAYATIVINSMTTKDCTQQFVSIFVLFTSLRILYRSSVKCRIVLCAEAEREKKRTQIARKFRIQMRNGVHLIQIRNAKEDKE